MMREVEMVRRNLFWLLMGHAFVAWVLVSIFVARGW